MTPRYRRQVLAMDKNIDLDSNEAIAAALLIWSARNPPKDVRRAIAATGVPSVTARGIAEKLRRNRIWWNGKLHHSGWDDEKTGGIAFWMDVCCGVGLMKKSFPSSPVSGRSSDLGKSETRKRSRHPNAQGRRNSGRLPSTVSVPHE